MSRRILILVDYRGVFWGSTRNPSGLWSMNIRELGAAFESRGYAPEFCEYADLDLQRSDLVGLPVVYTSAEDIAAHYKRFIQSKLLGLWMAGACLIPSLHYFLAHHDKSAMEALRQVLLRETTGQPQARIFGTLEEFNGMGGRLPSVPAVLKPSQGAASHGVMLYRGQRLERLRLRRMMHSAGASETLKELIKRLIRRGHVPHSLHRRAIVLQEFRPGLSGDYKVLRFGNRFYVMYRACPPGDFRASGARLWDHAPGDGVDLDPLLDAASEWSSILNSPFCSMDIGYDPSRQTDPFLIEFQCVNFGPSAAEKSPGYYRIAARGWEMVPERCVLEDVFAETAVEQFETWGNQCTSHL